MDFYRISTREIERGPKKGELEIYPDFIVGRSNDLMVKGKQFYAIWDESSGLWSRDEYDVQRIIDADLRAYADRQESATGQRPIVKYLSSASNGGWYQFRRFMQNISDNAHDLDNDLTFANTEVRKQDYVSKRLPYPLAAGDHSAWDELVGTLYNTEERAKIEWFIGAIVSGDSKKIQKFAVFYGPGGTGKSTILNIVEKLFVGYTTTFEAKALGSNNNAFATEAFKDNPLVAIQQDGDLSNIQDNTKLNSIISHEDMSMNEKYKPGYTSRVNAVLLMGTNQPVKITDAKSGTIRRLIDIHPTGVHIPTSHYFTLIAKIDFELGAIAQHCLDVYLSMGRNYYQGYRPLEMMLQTDIFFNFIEANFDVFSGQEYVTLKQAYALYKEYCADTGIERTQPQYKIREELRNYFEEFHDRKTIEGHIVRSVYEGFNASRFKTQSKRDTAFSLVIEETESLLDKMFADRPAQYATPADTPKKKWNDTLDEDGNVVRKGVKTTLSQIDTSQVHFVKVPENHIVIDFDLRDENGQKSLERNLEAASNWPATYAELSKSGDGVHLHYNFDGDTSELASVFSEGIEVKVFRGDSSLRRRLTKCNAVAVATINSGLPIKEKKVLSADTIQNEKGLRSMIERNLNKEFHGHTKSSVDFIKKILDDAYDSGIPYDVRDMRARITAFANNSSNQAMASLKTVMSMKFQSEAPVEAESPGEPGELLHDVSSGECACSECKSQPENRIVLYDVEVYPNLFVVCWKYQGSDTVVRMINPSPTEVEKLFAMKLVGFNNRRYDNHILWARFLGYSNEELYRLSQAIINNDGSKLFAEAYSISYADIYDFSSKKQGLKKFQIELGIPHKEMDISWDEPVPDDKIDKVVEYCVNDVLSTEAVLEDREQDLVARQILAELSGLSINDTTARHTARIIFGKDRNPQASFNYPKLQQEFPGYEFDSTKKTGKSSYRGEDPGEGGYVYAEPGIYENVVELDIASMHPTTIVQLNLFGEYTPNFEALKAARIAIKHGDYDAAEVMLGGRLKPFLQNRDKAQALSYALKIVINIVYGLTSAKFDNPFRDRRNVDNVVAKRGALFMIDLKHAVQEKGYQVIHIKTDSIKIPGADQEIIDFVTNFGAKYGYDFENEGVYEKFCLVNDAVYVARKNGVWSAVGAQFQQPYVFKTLFSHEPITFADMCEAKSVQKGAIYLDFEHDQPSALVEGMQFIGRTGLFVPVTQEGGGGVLYKVMDGKNYAVQGTKGHLWMEASMAQSLGSDLQVDTTYFDNLIDTAYKAIEKFGDFEEFVS